VQESFYDHTYITFRIEKRKVIINDCNYNGVKYITTEEGFKQFEENFIVAASKKPFKERQLLQKTIGLKSVPW
jgi:hypothetical protein